jgi:hypothetical protein
MKLEIVSHCWRYSRLLDYQLSSLILYPPQRTDLLMTVFLTEEDRDTWSVVKYFESLEKPANVRIRGWDLPREKLLRRLIGRNLAALATEADWIWFADCDYLFRDGALDALEERVGQVDGPLVFPAFVWVNPAHALGDRAIAAASSGPHVLDINPTDFARRRYRRAIGGVQIARGDAVRRLGYCRHSRRQGRPASGWARTCEDPSFRHSLGTGGTRIDVPNVFRIRHSTRGAN